MKDYLHREAIEFIIILVVTMIVATIVFGMIK